MDIVKVRQLVAGSITTFFEVGEGEARRRVRSIDAQLIFSVYEVLSDVVADTQRRHAPVPFLNASKGLRTTVAPFICPPLPLPFSGVDSDAPPRNLNHRLYKTQLTRQPHLTTRTK